MTHRVLVEVGCSSRAEWEDVAGVNTPSGVNRQGRVWFLWQLCVCVSSALLVRRNGRSS